MSAKGEQTRERILNRAIQMASTDGLSGLTIGELASDLKLSKSGLFAHFRSKERLQVAVLQSAADHFERSVLAKSVRVPRGEPRIRALFENWLAWGRSDNLPGGCPFIAAGAEFDDQPGLVRKQLAEFQSKWFEFIAKAARLAIDAGHFGPDTEPDQFAFELQGIYLSFHHAHRLLRRRDAEERVRRAFEHLIARARMGASSPV